MRWICGTNCQAAESGRWLKMAVPLMGTLHRKWHKQMYTLGLRAIFGPKDLSGWLVWRRTSQEWLCFLLLRILWFSIPTQNSADFLSQTQPRIAQWDPDWVAKRLQRFRWFSMLQRPKNHGSKRQFLFHDDFAALKNLLVTWRSGGFWESESVDFFSLAYIGISDILEMVYHQKWYWISWPHNIWFFPWIYGLFAYCLAIRYDPNGSTNWIHRYFLMAAVVKGMRELSEIAETRELNAGFVAEEGHLPSGNLT